MICTEKDASERWCPQVRHVPILDEKALSPANRFGPENKPDVDNPTFARCIGSRCMMWVWVADELPNRVEVGRDDVPQMVRLGFRREDPTEDELVYVWMVRDADCGTCGLINRSGP